MNLVDRNALAIAEWLSGHAADACVFHPGLSCHPQPICNASRCERRGSFFHLLMSVFRQPRGTTALFDVVAMAVPNAVGSEIAERFPS
jgi:cystathionine beta-lyase/cystathionine gamma-synthase